MCTIGGFIFDLDGVLVDTARFHYLAWRRLAREELNFDLTPELNEHFKGINRAACMKLLCEWTGATLSPEAFTALADRKNAWYVEYVDRMTPSDVLPGAREFVLECKKAGLKTAIGSASRNCHLVLERTGLAPLFDAVADGTVVTRAKPDPEVFLAAARLLGLSPAECVVSMTPRLASTRREPAACGRWGFVRPARSSGATRSILVLTRCALMNCFQGCKASRRAIWS